MEDVVRMDFSKSSSILSNHSLAGAKLSQVAKPRPEWLRIPEAIRLFGLGRSTLYELLAEGRIKSASIRKRGNVRGIRLISADSLSQYIEEQVEQTSK